MPYQCHSRSCFHCHPDGSHKRHGSEDHRFASPTESLGSWLDGLPYPEPDQDSIQVLKNADAQPACSNLHLSTEEAFGRAYQAIENYRRSKVACLAPGKRNMYPARKLPFMVFDQLDRELFRSVLKGNVHLGWSTHLPDGIYARTSKGHRNEPRITICLSKSLSEAPRVYIFCTLVHQMIHAYFLQCCGCQAQDGGSGGHDLCHGPEFRALLLTIDRRCSLNGYHTLLHLATDLPTPPGPRPTLRRRRSQPTNRSNCYASVFPMRGVARIDDQNWRDTAIAKVRSLDEEPKLLPMQQSDVSCALEIMFPVRDRTSPAMLDFPTPAEPGSPSPTEPKFYFIEPSTSTILPPQARSQYPLPSESYIELHFGSHAFPLPRDRIAPHLAGLAKSPRFTNDRILLLPAWSDSTDLVILYAFLLCTPPTSSPIPRANLGLPVIGTHDPESNPAVKSYISVFQLALALEFMPLAVYAFNALHSLRYTHENPIAVLERIYHRHKSLTPIPGLRIWTKHWLAHRIPADDGWEDYAARYPTNLSVIKEHPDWSSAYVALRERGTGLVTDLDAAEAEIASAQTPTSAQQQEQHFSLPHEWLFPRFLSTHQELNHSPSKSDEEQRRRKKEEEEEERRRKVEQQRKNDEDEWERFTQMFRDGPLIFSS